jgi:hypothetical protein
MAAGMDEAHEQVAGLGALEGFNCSFPEIDPEVNIHQVFVVNPGAIFILLESTGKIHILRFRRPASFIELNGLFALADPFIKPSQFAQELRRIDPFKFEVAFVNLVKSTLLKGIAQEHCFIAVTDFPLAFF